MIPAKILVLDTIPPSEKGFSTCTVVRDLKDLPDALKDADPLVFFLLDPSKPLPGQEIMSSQLFVWSQNLEDSSTLRRTIYTLVKPELSPIDSPQVTAVLSYLQSHIGPFNLSMVFSILSKEEDTEYSSQVLPLPIEPDEGLRLVLELNPDQWHHFKTSPPRLKAFLKLLPLLSEIGKRFLFAGNDDLLRELYQSLVPSSEPKVSQGNRNLLGPWSKKGSQGLIIVEGPIEASKIGEESITWIDDAVIKPEESFIEIAQKSLQEGKTLCILLRHPNSTILESSQFWQQISQHIQFILFWGKQWTERTITLLLKLTSYRIIGSLGEGNGLILQGSIDPSIPPIPIILADEDVGVTLPELYRKLSPPIRIRPSWDDYFLGIARAVAERATCDRGRSGCVIVRDKAILVTGYVGSPTGLPHCDEVGHQMKKMIHEDGRITQHCVRTVHAEQNAICQAAKYGISLNGGTLYCKMTPCRTCAMLIINCGIRRVVCEYRYHAGGESEELFRLAGIDIEFKHPEILPYSDQ